MSTPESATPPPVTAVAEDRTVAILSYITIIGFIIAIVMHGTKKTALGTYHLRQALGLFIAAVAVFICCSILSMIPVVNLLMIIVWPVAWLGLFVLWIMGLIAAANGEMKPMPVLGAKFQSMFANAFT